MSLTTTQAVLFRIKNDPAAREAFKADRAQFVAQFNLSAEEARALVLGNVAELWRLGVHPLLLVAFSRIAGMSAMEYRRLLRPLVGLRALRNEAPSGRD